MAYNIYGEYRSAGPYPPGENWNYPTKEAAALAIQNGGDNSTGGSTVTPAATVTSTKLEISVRVSGFLTPV